jgi:UDP-N-acetylglucosamine--N-acetylmuramyl-(pentapeptide) pyrophosphoryl-undecaprenol N-acetylglucosamine transferase
MIDVMKKAEVIISRAGAGTVSELMALKKRSIFIPLKIAQKNEQFFNALEAKNQLGSMVIEEEQFTEISLIKMIDNFQNSQNQKTSAIITHIHKATDFLLREIDQGF